MKKRLIQSILVLCLLCGFFVPVRVFADSATYFVMEAGECYLNIFKASRNYYNQHVTVESRAVILGNTWYLVCDQAFNLGSISGTSEGTACAANAYPVTRTARYNDKLYYISTVNYLDITYNPYNVPVVNDSASDYNAIHYTFGNGSVDPVEPVTWGLIDDVKFSTSISGSGSAAVNNIDHITWNPDQDTEGNVYDGQRVEIKAIPGTYTANSKNSLLTLGVSDFDYDSSREHIIGEFPVSNGQYDVTWADVISMLRAGSISDFLGIHKSDDVWLKSGWIYQIRLLDYAEDGSIAYEGQWQTIYTGTSSGVQNSLNIENSNTLNMALINTIQQINTNNNTVVNWEIGDVIINMDNQDGTETTDKPWWAYLLEAIVKAFGDLLAFLGNLIGDLLDGIVDLFRPTEFTINEYNDFKIEIKQNSGLFGQAIDFMNDLKNTFMGVQYQEPILHWQGISFGDTVFIPAADYNLNDYVTMWGLGDFRQLAYLCSDGFIFFSLLLLIIRKLNEVLKR